MEDDTRKKHGINVITIDIDGTQYNLQSVQHIKVPNHPRLIEISGVFQLPDGIGIEDVINDTHHGG